LFKFF